MLRFSIQDSSGEHVFVTERDEVLVGSREDADLRLPGAEPNHCILRAESGRVRLLSLAPGGTRVGGRNVGEAMFLPGQGFAVGGSTVTVLATAGASRLALEDPPAPPAAPPRPPARRAPAAPVAAAVAAAATISAATAASPHGAGAHEGDFAREVRATLARTPWYLISLTAHILLLLLLSLIEYRQPLPERGTHMTSIKRAAQQEPDLPDDAPLDLSGIDREIDQPEEINFDDPAPEARKAPADPTAPEFDEAMVPRRLGISGSRLIKLEKPLPYSKVKGGDKALNKSDITGEQGRATEEVKKGLGDGLHKARQRLSPEHIFVVRGAHDKIESILDGYDWPYTLVTRDQLILQGCPKARILFINCSNRPPPALANKLGEMVKRLLQHGCWVVTSDWSVEPYLTEAFPNIVRVLGMERSQRDTTVTVNAVAEDELLDGVFPRGGDSSWWLEDSSTMVAVTDKATLLVGSEDMRSRYGSRVVAFKFPYGNGMVLHLVGHFYQKDGNVHGLVAMHRLINNVILERVRADHGR